jgi:hypothetical protein
MNRNEIGEKGRSFRAGWAPGSSVGVGLREVKMQTQGLRPRTPGEE